jgi:hypothetical protein
MIFTYLATTAYLIYSRKVSFLFALLVFLAFVHFKIRIRRFRRHLKELVENFERIGRVEYSAYAYSYSRSIPSPDLFYLFHVFEVVFFRFFPSDRFACFLLFYEVFLFWFYLKMIKNFMSSDKFFENPIDFQMAEEEKIKIYCVGFRRSISSNFDNFVFVRGVGNSGCFIGEPLEEYCFYVVDK